MTKVTKPLAGVKHIKCRSELKYIQLEENKNDRIFKALVSYYSNRLKSNE